MDECQQSMRFALQNVAVLTVSQSDFLYAYETSIEGIFILYMAPEKLENLPICVNRFS